MITRGRINYENVIYSRIISFLWSSSLIGRVDCNILKFFLHNQLHIRRGWESYGLPLVDGGVVGEAPIWVRSLATSKPWSARSMNCKVSNRYTSTPTFRDKANCSSGTESNQKLGSIVTLMVRVCFCPS